MERKKEEHDTTGEPSLGFKKTFVAEAAGCKAPSKPQTLNA